MTWKPVCANEHMRPHDTTSKTITTSDGVVPSTILRVGEPFCGTAGFLARRQTRDSGSRRVVTGPCTGTTSAKLKVGLVGVLMLHAMVGNTASTRSVAERCEP